MSSKALGLGTVSNFAFPNPFLPTTLRGRHVRAAGGKLRPRWEVNWMHCSQFRHVTSAPDAFSRDTKRGVCPSGWSRVFGFVCAAAWSFPAPGRAESDGRVLLPRAGKVRKNASLPAEHACVPPSAKARHCGSGEGFPSLALALSARARSAAPGSTRQDRVLRCRREFGALLWLCRGRRTARRRAKKDFGSLF